MTYYKVTARLLLILAMLLLPSQGNAVPFSPGKFGLGIIVGEPQAGITMKYWKTSSTAIDGAAAWSSNYWTVFHGDYLVHLPNVISVASGTMPIYYGIGGFVRSYHWTRAGVRLPVGIAYMPPAHPLEFFLELAGYLGLVPSTSFDVGVGLGGRYYF